MTGCECPSGRYHTHLAIYDLILLVALFNGVYNWPLASALDAPIYIFLEMMLCFSYCKFHSWFKLLIFSSGENSQHSSHKH